MSRMWVGSVLGFGALVAAAGCVAPDEDEIETKESALSTVDSSIRGWNMFPPGSGGAPGHAVVYRNVSTGKVNRRTNTPLGAPLSMGTAALASGSSPWGYFRSDAKSAVLYVDVNFHVHEISGFSSGPFTDLDYNAAPINAPLIAQGVSGLVPDAIGYQRADGKSAVIYRSNANAVTEILRDTGGGWTVNNLTQQSGVPVSANTGSPFPYVRSDGYATVVYVASDNHVHELSNSLDPDFGSWNDYDLSAHVGDTVVPATDIWAYLRSDGWNSIVYTATDGQMHELAMNISCCDWGSYRLPAFLPSQGLARRPSGYVRADGRNAVVYINQDANVRELLLQSTGWVDSALLQTNVVASGQIFGHKAPGSPMRNSVLFKGKISGATDIQGYELSMPTGGQWSLQTF